MPPGIYERKSPVERFWPKVKKTRGCWLWTAAITGSGYGAFGIGDGKMDSAHRFSWILSGRSIPTGKCVLHRCDVRHCVNPRHLFLGTRRDNAHDCIRKDRWPIGERSSRAKLDERSVRDIIRSKLLGSDLAEKYGMSQSQISNIRNRRQWRHVHA